MIDPGKDWLLAEVGGELVASTLLMPRAPADGVVDVADRGRGQPAHRGRGIGSTLLPMMVGAREGVRRRAGRMTSSAVLRGQAISDDLGAAGLFESLGFAAKRWNFLMEADLVPAPSVTGEPIALPEGYTVHTWEGIDARRDPRGAQRRLRRAPLRLHPVGRPDVGAVGQREPRLPPGAEPGGPRRRRCDRGLRPDAEYDAVAETTGVREAFVAKVGTTPGHRRRGLASALLAGASTCTAQHGFDRSALDVDSREPVGRAGRLRARRLRGDEEVHACTSSAAEGASKGAVPSRRTSARSRVASRANRSASSSAHCSQCGAKRLAVALQAPPQPLVVRRLDPDQQRPQVARSARRRCRLPR